ncbi:trypsin-like serine peptidase [Lysinibacillus fusiformis]|uniref:trypsin-like serine peptidase n=1 Tax=Lysinibacillus fusiformis TaxID=28031 RepID=UPI000469AE48|nr:serine protease [Lysinibacillus fusiformis]
MAEIKMISLSSREAKVWNSTNEEILNKNERTVGNSDFYSVSFLEKAVQKSRSVAFIKLPDGGASGFLVANDLLLTNNHVFPDAQTADNAEVLFNYEQDIYNHPKNSDEYLCNSEEFFYTNKELDYSLVSLNRKRNGDGTFIDLPGSKWGFISLLRNLTIDLGISVNIIQHPRMRQKEVAFKNNFLQKIDGDRHFIKYTTDTEPGSSGSPAFNDNWDLIALHHASGDPDPDNPEQWLNNEGVFIAAIIQDLIKNLKDPKGKEILFKLGIGGLESVDFDLGASAGGGIPGLSSFGGSGRIRVRF